jgi:hypothetical protein
MMTAAFPSLALACARAVSLVAVAATSPEPRRPTVGTNRWDGCWQGSSRIAAVRAPAWRYVLSSCV